MKTKRSMHGRLAWVAYATALLILTGCAPAPSAPRLTESPAATATPAAGVVLEYKMPAGQVLRYQDKSEMRQVSDLMGESVETVITSSGAYSFQAKGPKERNFLLGVTIDSMGMTISTPRGDLSPDMKSVIGKNFDMVLSPLGAEVDLAGAEAITYEMVTGTRHVAIFFKVFFPDVPGKSLKVGDTWPSNFVIEDKSGGATARLEFQSVNTLEGWETVDGLECARIRSKVTGTVSGSGKQQGFDTITQGSCKGTDVWYFATKEGIFVKLTSELTTEMTVSLSGAQSMTIPTTQTRKSETKLVGR